MLLLEIFVISCGQKRLLIEYAIVLRNKAYTFLKLPPLFKDCLLDYRKIHVGKDLSRSLIPPLAQNSISYEIKPRGLSEGFVQSGLENLQGWRLHHLFKQSVPMLDCPHHEKVFPYVQLEVFFFYPLSLFLSQATLSKAWLHLLDGLLTGVGRLLGFLSKSSCLHESIYCFRKVWLATDEQSYLV